MTFANQTFGVLIFQGVEELDFVGPWEMLAVWNKQAGGPECCIVAQDCKPIICAKGMSVNPHKSFKDCLKLDYLLIPGGQIVLDKEFYVDNPQLINFVKKQAEKCKAVLSVCTGSFILHKAGLLTRKKATTHWGCLSQLRALGDVTVVEERYTRDGNIWCSAGVSAGTDMTLKFIADIVAENSESPIVGEEVAGKVQQWTEYYPSSVTYGLYTKNSQAPAYIRNA